MNTFLITPKPENLPKDLTKLSSSYIFKASIAILAILLFFVLYIGLIIGLSYLVYIAFTYSIDSINKFTILVKLGAIAASIMLVLFSIKFILKLKNHKPYNRVKLVKKDNEELFLFIDDICKSTGAPKPKNIYVDPDVNAYVSYTNVWLSLFLPTKKELTIGLGLVSTLNLSEFKAVVAHEFGHFAQKSMKIGSYIHSANTIIHDMIFSRDKWDELLDRWRNSDIRLSAAAWIITPIIWCIRKMLMLFYMMLNMMHSLLSREMEFNADKVAVSVSGSEAIVSALWKLEYGYNNWNLIIQNAFHASKKEVFSKNLYHHKAISLEKQKETILNSLENLPKDEKGIRTFFSSSENSKVSMYASHPPNDLREKNAKNPFLPCEIDDRSPWILFSNKDKLQKELTFLIYEKYINKTPKDSCEETEFQNFIDSEAIENTLFEEYENTFLNRFINIPTEKEIDLHDTVNTNLIALKDELKQLMLPVKEIESLMLKANEIASGTTKDKSLTYKNISYTKKEITKVYDLLIKDRDFLFNNNFTNWDKSLLCYFYDLARKVNNERELMQLYLQHKKIIYFYQSLINAKNDIIYRINNLQNLGEVTQQMVANLSHDIKDIVKKINNDLLEFYKLDFVALPNIDSVEELKKAIFDEGKITEELGIIFENGGLDRIIIAIDNGIINCNRIENKNLEQLLKYFKELESLTRTAENL